MIHHIADLSICWEIVFLMHNVPYTHFIKHLEPQRTTIQFKPGPLPCFPYGMHIGVALMVRIFDILQTLIKKANWLVRFEGRRS